MLGTFHVGVAKARRLAAALLRPVVALPLLLPSIVKPPSSARPDPRPRTPQELFSHGLLPRVVAGSSAGAIVSAVLCTRTDAELHEFFRHWPRADEPATRLFLTFFGENGAGAAPVLRRLLRTGALYEYKGLRANLRRLLGDFTFLESFQRTGRIMNVSVSSTRWNERPRLLNYLTAPHCVVWSAVAASAAFPGLYEPQVLLSRDQRGRFVHFSAPASVVGGANAPWEAVWRSMSRSNLLMHRPFRDGSVEADLPFQCAPPDTVYISPAIFACVLSPY